MEKPTTLIFYGRDGDAAKAAAATIRKNKEAAQVRHAEAYQGESEPCTRVLLLPDVSAFDRRRVAAVYGEKVVESADDTPPPPPPTMLPPPPPVDPLATLAADWRENADSGDLKRIAAAVGGRVVEDRDQAVQVIEDEITKRMG